MKRRTFKLCLERHFAEIRHWSNSNSTAVLEHYITYWWCAQNANFCVLLCFN